MHFEASLKVLNQMNFLIKINFRTLHIEWLSSQPKYRLSYYNVVYAFEDKSEIVTVEVKNSSGNSHKVRPSSSYK